MERRGRVCQGAAMGGTTRADEADTNVLRLTVTIVSAHIRNNQVAANTLPELIQSVHRSLATAGMAELEPEPALLTPAVPIRRSVFPS